MFNKNVMCMCGVYYVNECIMNDVMYVNECIMNDVMYVCRVYDVIV